MSSYYRKNQKNKNQEQSKAPRVPYEQWKAMHPEKYGVQATGKGAYKLSGAKKITKNGFMSSPFGRTMQSELARAIVKGGVLAAGTAMGAPLVGMAAAGMASRAMSGRGMYTGRGSYHQNSLVGPGVAPEVPSFSTTGDETGAVTVTRREYITDIYGPTSAFNVQSFNLNPGLESVFPWLSQIAQNYDEYEFKQLMFTYRSTTTDIGTSTNGQCGTVIMCTNYNAASGPFSDKVVMMEYDGAMSSKVTDNMVHGVECDPSKLSGAEAKYVRANPVVSNQDLKTYDHGLFQLAIANSPAGFQNNVVGELWVSYTVVLRKPKFFVARGLGISRDYYVSADGQETTSFPFGNAATILSAQQNNIGTSMSFSANTATITFPASYAGNVRIVIACELALTTNGTVNLVTATGNVAQLKDLYASGANSGLGDSPQYLMIATDPGQRQMICIAHFRITPATGGVNNSITYTTNFAATAPTQSSIDISEFNSGFSYKAQNIGPSNNQSDAPILVNPQGVVIVP